MNFQRPHTTVILAMTVDGKIADYQRNPARFSSNNDKNHLENQIAQVDAVLFGAATLRTYGTSLPITNPRLLQQRNERHQPSQPIHIVCSASGKIDPNLPFFRQPLPRWLLTTALGANDWQESYQDNFEKILPFEQPNNVNANVNVDWDYVFNNLYQSEIYKLAILGGGTLIASLFEADLIDELWLTICPIILGGKTAPTPVEGTGFIAEHGKILELLSIEKINQELFLHYRVNR